MNSRPRIGIAPANRSDPNGIEQQRLDQGDVADFRTSVSLERTDERATDASALPPAAATAATTNAATSSGCVAGRKNA